MENNLMELWSLLSITARACSRTRPGSRTLRPADRASATSSCWPGCAAVPAADPCAGQDRVAADLPPKQIQRVEIDLDPAHRRIYQRHLQRERQKVLGLLSDVDRNRFTILQSLTLLRQLGLHGLTCDQTRRRGQQQIDALVAQLAGCPRAGTGRLVFSQFAGFLALVKARHWMPRHRHTPTWTARPATAGGRAQLRRWHGPEVIWSA
ncbi:hypothetical protein HBB16_08555 [Pseudonocardia sp. MCCB 268]|nr:hypothetical protein [Pseudonocardia cytotoxica]